MRLRRRLFCGLLPGHPVPLPLRSLANLAGGVCQTRLQFGAALQAGRHPLHRVGRQAIQQLGRVLGALGDSLGHIGFADFAGVAALSVGAAVGLLVQQVERLFHGIARLAQRLGVVAQQHFARHPVSG